MLARPLQLITSLALALVLITGCGQRADDPSAGALSSQTTIYDGPKTRVIVLGTVHSRHEISTRYSLDFLEGVIRDIDPDVILSEIPPDRFDDAITSFTQTGKVTEPRVARFPEYTQVIIPLQPLLGYTLVPTAAWTLPMAEYRTAALNQLARDPNRQEDWAAYTAALDAMNVTLKGREDDPFFIHTDEYDAIVKKGLAPYAERFAGDLGTGDWNQINEAHYELISGALDQITGEGKTVVITFGAAHKYWFLEALADRTDIQLVSPQAYLEAAVTAPRGASLQLR